MASTKINDLIPALQPMAGAFLIKAKQAGFNIRITSTYRTLEEQAQLYANGRGSFVYNGVVYKASGNKIVTNAKPGQSKHNLRMAFDVVDKDKGYNIDWEVLGKIGEEIGLSWGGRWKFQDKPHFEYINKPINERGVEMDNNTVPAYIVKEIYKAVRGSEPTPDWPDFQAATSDRPLAFIAEIVQEAKNVTRAEQLDLVRGLQGQLEESSKRANQLQIQLTDAQSHINGDFVPLEPNQLYIKR